MIGESENPTHEVHMYIDGLKLEGDFIPFNTGVDVENTINSLRAELTTGKDYVKYLNKKSKVLSFKTILTDPLAEDGYEDILIEVVAKAKKKPVKIIFNNDQFMGMVLEFSISFPPQAYREYTWLIVETKPFDAVEKKFNTYNYKKATTATKTTSNTDTFVKTSPTIEVLLKCTPVYNCGKFGVSCVTSWQTYLTSEGYYGAKGYRIDGQYCTYTKLETARWQKNNKLKDTGKVDAATKAFLTAKHTGKPLPVDPITTMLNKFDALARK